MEPAPKQLRTSIPIATTTSVNYVLQQLPTLDGRDADELIDFLLDTLFKDTDPLVALEEISALEAPLQVRPRWLRAVVEHANGEGGSEVVGA